MRWMGPKASGGAIVAGGAVNLLVSLALLSDAVFAWPEATRTVVFLGPALLMFLGIPGVSAALQPRSQQGVGIALLAVAVGLLLRFLGQVATRFLLEERADFETMQYASLPVTFGAATTAIGLLFLGGLVWNEERLSRWRRVFLGLGSFMVLGFLGFYGRGALGFLVGIVIAVGWILVGLITVTERWRPASESRERFLTHEPIAP